MNRSEITKMIICMSVDHVNFTCEILPSGMYIIYGPSWLGLEDNVLSTGELTCGYIFPNLVKSIEELIRLKLKT
jgi:hypothetical protein